MDSYDYGFYERLKDLITSVRESEQKRLQLEWQLGEWNRPDMKKAKEKASKLKKQLKSMEEEERNCQERNSNLLKRLNKLESRLQISNSNSSNQQLDLLKRNCKNYFLRQHPNWKQYKDVLQSQFLEAYQMVNDKSRKPSEKMQLPTECLGESETVDFPGAGGLAPSNTNENNPTPRFRHSRGMSLDSYVTPPEKPQRCLPRNYDGQTGAINTSHVYRPGMTPGVRPPLQPTEQFALQNRQILEKEILRMNQGTSFQQMQFQNPVLSSFNFPLGSHLQQQQQHSFQQYDHPQLQQPIMMQVPLEYNSSQFHRINSQEELYFGPNKIQPSTFYQPKQVIIQGGGSRMDVPEVLDTKVTQPNSLEERMDSNQPCSSVANKNREKLTNVDSLGHPPLHEGKLSETFATSEKVELQQVKSKNKECQISPEAQQNQSSAILTSIEQQNIVDAETSIYKNSLENLTPVRALHSPEPVTPGRKIVKPIFSDIELTGDFDSQIVYGQTPPSHVAHLKSNFPELDRKSLNTSQQQVSIPNEMRRASVESEALMAVPPEDTEFGITSLPDHQHQATMAGRISVSESGYKRTGDMTTAEGLSNSIPGVHLSPSLSQPEERSDISDFETENSSPPAMETKNTKPAFHLSDQGISSPKNRQSKKNLRRSSSPVTPALSVEGLLLLMKMVEHSFRTASCSKDEYYRSFQPSDEERGRIISEANKDAAASLTDADPALVSMVILEQMTVIIRSLSTGCLLPDTLLQSQNLLDLSENSIKSHMTLNTIGIWKSVFVHFTSILKYKVMNPKEIAAVFVPCLLQRGSTFQEKAFKLLVKLLENVSQNLSPIPMELQESLENSSDESPVIMATPQRPKMQTMKENQGLVSSIEKVSHDSSEEDSKEDPQVQVNNEKSNEINISQTPAYKNMLFGLRGSNSVDEEIENSASDSDELEKEFGTTIPETRQTLNPLAKSTISVTGVATNNVPSVYSNMAALTEDEDSRDYDFYD